MTPESVMMMGTEAMKVALALAAPLLLVALVTGLIISILQAATQINEMTLSFIPKSSPYLLPLLLPDRGCSICCWITSAPCSLTCRISSGSPYNDAGDKRSMAFLAKSVLLAVTARAGAHFYRANSERTQRAETGKLGLAMMITFAIAHHYLPTMFLFFVLCSVAGRAADPDWHCAWFYHAICLCRCANRWRNYRSANGAVICDVCRSGQPSQYACLARIMDMLALLLFLTFNGHLWLISLLVDTFHTLPIGGEPLNSNAFLALTKAGV